MPPTAVILRLFKTLLVLKIYVLNKANNMSNIRRSSFYSVVEKVGFEPTKTLSSGKPHAISVNREIFTGQIQNPIHYLTHNITFIPINANVSCTLKLNPIAWAAKCD